MLRLFDAGVEGLTRLAVPLLLDTQVPASQGITPEEGTTAGVPAESEHTLQVELWLRVENNSTFVRGKKKARLEIEEFVLRRYGMRKPAAARSDYILSITNCIDAELDQAIYEILPEAERLADLRYCFIEADVIALCGSERS